MSYDEVIYKNDIFPSIEMNHIHPKDDINTTDEREIEIFNPFEICQIPDCIDEKKKVRFPEESNIVSDYFEARNYWQEQRFCSCEELINSYKKACEVYNIKPVPILLEQIKGIDVGLCNERYDMLNLSNVKLDLKHVESMEEIFKRVQFKTLNFENTGLDDESAASLFEIIEFYESCLKLNLSHNSKISYPGFNACSRMLKKTPCLDTIEFKGIIFTDTTIPPLNRALRCGSNLKVLHLENSNICSKNLLILSSALKLNIHLKELHLSSNRMVPSDGIQLGSLLKVNRLIETLDVRNNSLGDVGLSHICDGLSEQFQSNRADNESHGQGLLCLILWSNSITYNGMPSLSDALKATKSLQSLNLGNNAISSEGVHILREGLLANHTLLRLSLPCCRITCEGGVAIAEYLADTKQLMRLDIRDNDIRTAGLMAISLSMKVNKSLTRLDVDPSPKKDPNVKGFVETQTESLRIIQQRVIDNKRVTMEKQEMELSQSFICLSNQPQDTTDNISDLNSNLLEADESSDCKKPLESENLSEPVVNGIDPLNEPIVNATKVSLSLDLSPDSDNSVTFLGNFANKLLSPTDSILDIDIKPSFNTEKLIDSSSLVKGDTSPDDNNNGHVESFREQEISDDLIRSEKVLGDQLVEIVTSVNEGFNNNEDQNDELLQKGDLSQNIISVPITDNVEDESYSEKVASSNQIIHMKDDLCPENEETLDVDIVTIKEIMNVEPFSVNASSTSERSDQIEDQKDDLVIPDNDPSSMLSPVSITKNVKDESCSDVNDVSNPMDSSDDDLWYETSNPTKDTITILGDKDNLKTITDNTVDKSDSNTTSDLSIETFDSDRIIELIDNDKNLSSEPFTEDLTVSNDI